uniref:Uncharacterized protein n=1 Tax=Oryza sativa subsp. japonica TaxID=39947 RepID=Q7XIA8_ORYSJ|nr:hypothetical protein [Oryza sativa Japonica Group]BAD30479.1 hypothetical protein [Oryza sativa Japonica Group]
MPCRRGRCRRELSHRGAPPLPQARGPAAVTASVRPPAVLPRHHRRELEAVLRLGAPPLHFSRSGRQGARSSTGEAGSAPPAALAAAFHLACVTLPPTPRGCSAAGAFSPPPPSRPAARFPATARQLEALGGGGAGG